MRANAVILVVIALLFLVGTVAAIIPDTVTITSDKSYLVANNVDQSVINVVVTNTTSGVFPISGATVTFSVMDPVYGTLSRTSGMTDPSGSVSSIFKVNTKSGFANIAVAVSYYDGNNSFSQNSIITQKIDHDKPNKVIFIPPYEGTVNTPVAFNASFTDQWGNPIDNIINLNESHTVTIHVHGPAPDDCNFTDVNNVALGKDIFDTPLDNTGNVPMKIKLTSVTGNNYLSMEAFGLNIPAKVIRAIPGVPFYITQEFAPDTPPKLPIGASFSFTYTLYDKFMNPAGGKMVWVNMSSSQSKAPFITQENGKISGTYTEPITGLYTLTATAVDNTSVTISKIVEFYAGTATSHNVLANPKSMPSLDANPGSNSTISVKVVDEGGNGVNGQIVYFSLSNVQYSPSGVGITSPPSFSNGLTTIDAITGADGINGTATVKFIPGEFVTTGPTYSQSATGNATVTATWNGTPKVVEVTWKNYAYLSAVLTVKPPQVKVGDTVDVNLKLNGDGWSLGPKPIDVVVVIDRSGSMAWNTPNSYVTGSGPRRIVSAKDAANTFINTLKGANNRVGFVSFESTTTLVDTLTTDLDGVQGHISSLPDNPTGATQMRRALYEAIKDVKDHPRADAVKAVIILTDGDWNYDGSPLAVGNGFPDPTSNLLWPGNVPNFDSYQYYNSLGGGSSHTATVPVPDGNHWDGSKYVADYVSRNRLHYDAEFTSQNMSFYAQENGVRLYAISFVNQPSTQVIDALTIMTTSTGDDEHRGYYKHAEDAAVLNTIYAEIANQLTDDAGIDTTADMDFGQLFVDDQLIDTTTPGNATFDYVGDPITPGINPNGSATTAPGSTMVSKYNSSTQLIPGPEFTEPGPWIINQTPDWNANKALSFNIGLVKRGETWETNFRLRVLKEGTILLFSPRSTVDFTDSLGKESSLPLNNLSYFTVVKDNSSLVIQKIEVLTSCPEEGEYKDPLLPIKWTTTYNGSATTIFEEVRYMSESGAWLMFYSNSYGVSMDDSRNRSATFDMRRVAPGKYAINIKAYTTGSKATSSPMCGPFLYNTTGMTFIRLD
jgi:hypothetical protein